MGGKLQMSRKSLRAVLILFLAMPLSIGRAQPWRSLRQRIPKPDSLRYRAIRDARDWKNPFLIVRPDGVEVVGVNAGRATKVDSVEKALEALPNSAWPYGLVVAVQDAGVVSSEKDNLQIQANRRRLVEVLRNLSVEVDPWPSA